MTTAGELDRRITILRREQGQDDLYGTEKTGWEPVFARVPAKIRPDFAPDAETERGGLELSTQTWFLTLRYLSGLTAAMRIIIHGENDQLTDIISGPVERGRREWMDFKLREIKT